MNEFISKGIIIGKQSTYEFDGKTYYKLPLLLGVPDADGNFTDKAVVGAAKSDAPILNDNEIKFGARIMCTVNVKTYEGKTSYACTDVTLVPEKQK